MSKCRAVRRKELGKVTADVILSYPTGLIVSFDFGVEDRDVTDHIDVIDGQVLLLALQRISRQSNCVLTGCVQ